MDVQITYFIFVLYYIHVVTVCCILALYRMYEMQINSVVFCSTSGSI